MTSELSTFDDPRFAIDSRFSCRWTPRHSLCASEQLRQGVSQQRRKLRRASDDCDFPLKVTWLMPAQAVGAAYFLDDRERREGGRYVRLSCCSGFDPMESDSNRSRKPSLAASDRCLNVETMPAAIASMWYPACRDASEKALW